MKDLSIDYTDDEDDYEVSELQTLAAPLSKTITRMAEEQPQNKNDTDHYEESQFPQPLLRCKDFLDDKRSQENRSSNSLAKSSHPQGKEIKTKLCKNIVKIVGGTDYLYKLDTTRQNLKNIPQLNFTKAVTLAFLHLCKVKFWLVTRLLKTTQRM